VITRNTGRLTPLEGSVITVKEAVEVSVSECGRAGVARTRRRSAGIRRVVAVGRAAGPGHEADLDELASAPKDSGLRPGKKRSRGPLDMIRTQ